MFYIQEESMVKIIHTIFCRVFQQSLDVSFLFMVVLLIYS